MTSPIKRFEVIVEDNEEYSIMENIKRECEEKLDELDVGIDDLLKDVEELQGLISEAMGEEPSEEEKNHKDVKTENEESETIVEAKCDFSTDNE